MRRIAASVVVLGCLGLYALPSATAGASPSSPGRYIVVLRDSVADPGAVSAAHGRAHQAQVSHVYRKALKGYAATIPADRVDDIRADSRVAYVEADGTVSAVAKPGGGGGTAPPQTTPPGITAVGATASSTQSGDGTGSVIADLWVIDTGVDIAHPDLHVV
ncbi:MAG: protease inhibitor I9 family protein, partial [Acidimicrobiia bacterium]